MPKRPTDNLLWLLLQAYRVARKRGVLPGKPPETQPERQEQAQYTHLPDRNDVLFIADDRAEPASPDLRGQPAETYTDPTEAEAEADRRLMQATVRAASDEPRRYRQRLFQEKPADGAPERPLPQLKTRIEELADYFAQRKEFKSLDMYYLVIYDIQDNRIRTHLFNYLKERGLYHLQKSVFLGRNDRAAYKRIYDAVRRIESTLVETDSIVFMPIAENELRKFRIVGRDVEVNAALDEPHTLVF